MIVLRHLFEYEFGKRNPLYQIRATSFVSIIIYLTCATIKLYRKNSFVCDCLPNFSITTLVKFLSLFIKKYCKNLGL